MAVAISSQKEQSRAAADSDSFTNTAVTENTPAFGHLSLFSRLLLFLLLPSLTGLCGLLTAHLKARFGKPTSTSSVEEYSVNFDRDFVTPFLLSLALVIVIGFQTRGYKVSGGDQKRLPFAWPKTRRIKQIRKERVLVDDDHDTKKKQI